MALDRTILLLIAAILVALLARRLRLPYTVGLVVTGLALALARIGTGTGLTHELIFGAILPPLLFEAAINIHWRELRRDALPVLTLATLGVVISSLVVAAGMEKGLGWPWPAALLFGILIAATDPVAVIAMFKDTGVAGRLRLLVEGESLLNDGVAAVLFALALAWAEVAGASTVTPVQVAQALGLTAGGGVFVGLACGGVALRLAGKTTDHLVETSLTTVAAYGSFLLAEYLHFSGVLATVTAGLFLGNLGVLQADNSARSLSERGRVFVLEFWEFVAFLANSLIFLLIGLRVADIPFRSVGLGALLTAIGLVLVGRALAVYPLCLPFLRSRWRISLRDQHVLFWGGLRGALALALCLSLPRALPMRDEIVIATFGVVVFSVIVQGLTMPRLLLRLAFLPGKTPRGKGHDDGVD